jgi:GNAT superfamily N-acetyltransferase
MTDSVARDIELHEARAWAACVEAAAEAEGNPLLAEVDRSPGIAVPALGAIDFGLFNRVIGLGVGTAADDAQLDAVLASYARRRQSAVVLEVCPVSEPADLPDRLTARGLADTGHRQAKTWQQPALYEGPGMDAVVALGPDDVDEFAQVNMIAWEVPAFLAVWFGATLFADDFRHFGVKVDGRIVSTGAMYVTDGIAWLGFGATLPEFRGRGMQTAILARRVHEAAVLGCRLVHSETSAHTAERRNPSLDNMLTVGFEHAYDKQWWSFPASSGTS